MDSNTRIIDLTVGELLEVLRTAPTSPQQPKRYVYGYKGVQDLFNCSRVTAGKLINGKIKEAVRQTGRKIVVDADKALALCEK